MSLLLKEFSDFKQLGKGGMENVYLATQIILNRKVVIKKLPSNMPPDPNLIKRLENQATSAAGLDHKNIIKVFDFGKEGHSFFIAMEYIDGFDLGRVMRWRPFPLEIGLMVLLQSIKGLNYAHKLGIIHCNIKPGNILISKTGKVKVADFGLGHAYQSTAEFNESSSDFMTLNYMPPEVAGGSRDRNISMDIWSTGVLAYHIICGTLPFVGSDFQKLVRSIVHDDVQDVRSADPTLPDDLATEVNACLEKNPHRRPASVERLLQSLENFLYDLGVRDIDGIIMNYIADKNSVATELSDLVLKYYKKKSNEFIDTTDRVQPKALFSGPKVQINAPKGGVLPAGKPIHHSRAFFDNFFHLKKAVAVISIAVIVLLIVASVFLIVRNKQKAGPLPSINALPTEIPHGPSARNPEQSAPGVSHAENGPLADHAPSMPESTSVDGTMKNPVSPASPGEKKPRASRINNLHKRKLAAPPEKPNTAIVNPIGEKKKGIGLLHIHSYPWAEIYIDDIFQGTSPTPKPLSLPEGEHTMVLKREGFKPHSETVYIFRDEEKRIKVQLEQ
jgi:Serine/threonine protein kinase